MTLPKLPDFPEIRAIELRARDISPAHAKLRDLVASHMGSVEPTKSSKSTGNLDKSLSGLDIWRSQRLSVEWGTSVDYVFYHSGWRKKNNLSPVSLVNKKLISDALGTIQKYVLMGRRS